MEVLANFAVTHRRNLPYLPFVSTMISSFDLPPNSARDLLLPSLLPNPHLPSLARVSGEPRSLLVSHRLSPHLPSRCLTNFPLVDLVLHLPSTVSPPASVENKRSLPSIDNAKTRSLTVTLGIQRTIDSQPRTQRNGNDLEQTRVSLHPRVPFRLATCGLER